MTSELLEAFQEDFLFCRRIYLVEKYKNFLQKNNLWLFQEFEWRFRQIFQNSIIRLQRNKLKKPNFPENSFPLSFSGFWGEIWTFGETFPDLWRQLLRYYWQNCLPGVQKKNVGFQSCFPIMNALRLNVDKIGKQWVRRPIVSVDDFFSFIQNGGN